jgi:putative membrane protein
LVEKAFGNYAAQFICLFVGFVGGTFPSLYKTAGKQGRRPKDIVIFILSTVFIFVLMLIGGQQLTEVPPSVPVWLGSGALIGLGVIVPGMSPSNFLIYFGLYDKMATGIKDFDFAVIIPLLIGFAVCVLLFAKLAAYLFREFYPEMYHFILGMVVGHRWQYFYCSISAFRYRTTVGTGLSVASAFLCAGFLAVVW